MALKSISTSLPLIELNRQFYMELLLIDYLSPFQDLSANDLNSFGIVELAQIRVNTPINLIRELLNLNTDFSDVILTFLSHSNKVGLGNGDGDELYFISYEVLLPILNRCLTNYKLIINMMANCNSFGVEDFKTLAPCIDEFWITTQKAMSIPQAVIAISDYLKYNDSGLFEERNEYDTDFLFKRIVKG